MASKRQLHHLWVRLRPVSYWYFLVLAVISLVIGLYALRQNNLTSIRLREELLQVDKENGDVETALQNLREHIHSHMNADLSSGPTGIQQPVQLKYRYERLVTAEEQKVAAENEQIYTRAQQICEQQFPAGFGGAGRIPCIEQYVSQNRVEPNTVPDALYKFDFISPRWAPDLAGFSFLFAGVFFLLFVVRFGLEKWLKNQFD